jgi:hypothetical protein
MKKALLYAILLALMPVLTWAITLSSEELNSLLGQNLGATVCFPYQGCTGIGTVPSYGEVLVGNVGGTYTLTATSSLGISSSDDTWAPYLGSIGDVSTTSLATWNILYYDGSNWVVTATSSWDTNTTYTNLSEFNDDIGVAADWDALSDMTLNNTLIYRGDGSNNPEATSTLSVMDTGELRFPNLLSCDTLDTDAQGDLSCGTDASGGGGTWPADLDWSTTTGYMYPSTASDGIIVSASSTFSADLYVDDEIYFAGDVSQNTKIGFAEDRIRLYTGGLPFLDVRETAQNYAYLGNSGYDVDVQLLNSAGSLWLQGDTGFVGIGSTSPYAMLGVSGEGVFENLTATSTTATSTFQGGLVAELGIQFDDFTTCTALETDASGNLVCGTDDTGGGGGTSWPGTDYDWATTSDYMYPYDTADGIIVTASSSFGNDFVIGAQDDFFFDFSEKYLGLGTITPQTALHIGDASTSNLTTYDDSVFISGELEVAEDTYVGPIKFKDDSGMVSLIDMNITTAVASSTVEGYSLLVDGGEILTLYSQADGSGDVVMQKVGINTTTPDKDLSVTGDVYISGKAQVDGGVDPPYISFTGETEASIKEYAKGLQPKEKVMLFYNINNQRLEMYDVDNDKFSSLDKENFFKRFFNFIKEITKKWVEMLSKYL